MKKFVADRPFADPDVASRKIANDVEERANWQRSATSLLP
jgi:hypothetical protein